MGSHCAVCVYVYPPIVAKTRQTRSLGNEYTSNNINIFGLVVFYTVRVV
jgi:hypothetical protein